MASSLVLKSIKDLVFFITGGGSGLGAGCVNRFLSQGSKVVAFDLAYSDEQPESVDFLFIKGDVTSESDLVAAFEATVAKFGAVHVLVNCAGVLLLQKAYDPQTQQPHSQEDFQRVINVNLCGNFNAMRLAAVYMAKNKADNPLNANRCTDHDVGILARGVIINTGSVCGLEGSEQMVAYSTSKAAIIGMTLPLARDLAHIGVRVVTIAPGTCRTRMALGNFSEADMAIGYAKIPFPKRLVHTDEFAHLVESVVVNPMINAEVIRIDGGIRLTKELA